MDHMLKASDIINSWMRSINLKYIKQERTFFINDKKIIIADLENLTNDTLILKFSNIIHKDNDIVKNEFIKIITFLNVKAEFPLRTWIKPEKGEKYELSYLRAKRLIHAPNPPDHLLRKYEPVINKLAQKAFFKYKKTCQRAGFEYEDLASMGMVYLTIFLHSYEHTLKNGTGILYLYINQRFSEWNKWTFNKLKNMGECLPLDNDAIDNINYNNGLYSSLAEEYQNANFTIELQNGQSIKGRLTPKMASADITINGFDTSNNIKTLSIKNIILNNGQIKAKPNKNILIERHKKIIMDRLPDKIQCKKCLKFLPKEKIGVRVLQRQYGLYGNQMPWCKKCRSLSSAKSRLENRSA